MERQIIPTAKIRWSSTGLRVTLIGVGQMQTQSVYKDISLSLFKGLTEGQLVALKNGCKQAFCDLEDVQINLDSREVTTHGYVERAVTTPPTEADKRQRRKEAREQRSQWKAYNDLVNEGGEGFNPHDYGL